MARPQSVVRVCGTALVLGSMVCSVADAAQSEVSVVPKNLQERVMTVYSSGFGQIQDTYLLKFTRGMQNVHLSGLPLDVEASSLTLDGKGLALRDISINRPPQSTADYLQHMIGKSVKAVRVNPKTGRDVEEDAVLVALAPSPVLKVGDRLEIDYPGRVVLPADVLKSFADGVALSAHLDSANAGDKQLRVHYKLNGLDWQANYRALYDPSSAKIMLQGRVAVQNNTRTSFSDLNLRVVAGQVHQVHNVMMKSRGAGRLMAIADTEMASAPAAPVHDSGYLLYPVAKGVSLKAGERKDIAIVEQVELPVRAHYIVNSPVYAGPRAGGDWPRRSAGLRLEMKTKADTPSLPSGVMRVMTPQSDGADMLIGETRVPHTQPGGELRLDLGQAVDVTYAAKQTAFQEVSRNTTVQSYEVTLFNSSPKSVEVDVSQSFPGQWTITKESAPHKSPSSQTAKWILSVPAEGKLPLSFTVKVTRRQ